MQEIIIDEEFKALLPVLDEKTYAQLEENLIENGCRDSLVVWDSVLIDGHNRYEICTKHDIPFNIVNKEFNSREEALIWIVTTQVSRRNLSPSLLSYYRGLHYRTEKKIRGAYNQYTAKSENHHNDGKQKEQSTAGRLAEQYNVSRPTIERDGKASEAIDNIGETSPEAKRKILSGEVKLDKKALAGLLSGPKEALEAVAGEIKEGTYTKKKPEAAAPAEEVDTDGSVSEGTSAPHATIVKMTDDFSSELRTISKNGDNAILKTALRSFIDMLEEQYRQM